MVYDYILNIKKILLGINSMTTDQKLKIIQLSLNYVLSTLRSTETTEKKYEDMPLFVD